MHKRELAIFVLGLAVGMISMVLLNGAGSRVGGILANGEGFVYQARLINSAKLDSGQAAELTRKEGPPSHDEIDSLPTLNGTQTFEDHHDHVDDGNSLASKYKKKIRVLCWVMTSEDNLYKKAIHVKATWAKRCNKVLFVSDSLNKEFPTINITVQHGRDHLTAKTMKAFDFILSNYIDEYDWFMKVDDDTFVILENLRYMLAAYSRDDPVYFGHLFKTYVKQGYYSGGGGYVFSREALKRFGARKPGECREDGGAEDLEIGRCMMNLGVRTVDSRDSAQRSRFHCFDVFTHMRGEYPPWYYEYDAHGAKKGVTSLSDFPITFHYIKPQVMYEMEYFVYHLRAFGVPSDTPIMDDPPTSTTANTPTTKHISRAVTKSREQALSNKNKLSEVKVTPGVEGNKPTEAVNVAVMERQL